MSTYVPFPFYQYHVANNAAKKSSVINKNVSTETVNHTHCDRTHNHPLPPEGLAHHHGNSCLAGSGGATATTITKHPVYKPTQAAATYNYPASTPYYDYSAGSSSSTYGYLTGGGPTTTTTSGGYGYSAGGAHYNTPAIYPSISASRVFSGPTQYPPKDFAAYGIIAFTSGAGLSPEERDRFEMFCNAYVATLTHTSRINNLSRSQQMVTVWPVMRDDIADELNKVQGLSPDMCTTAVNNYDLFLSKQAIKDASSAGAGDKLRGKGPFLIAWSPAYEKGQAKVAVLILNMSTVSHPEHARNALLSWEQDIQENPDLWRNGFTEKGLQGFLANIRLFVDNAGPRVFDVWKRMK